MTVIRDRNLEVNQKIVKVHFSNSDIIKSYTTIGLWPSEENVIDRFFEFGSSILDIGCGAGRTSIALAQKRYNVTGIDFITEMIEAAINQAKSHNAKINFKVMDAISLDFPMESFQNVLFFI